jgi:hypothetical protein
MGSTAKQYRKKPVVIEAIRWTGTAMSATEVIDWALSHKDGTSIRYHSAQDAYDDGEEACPYSPASLAVDTLEGTMSAIAGDFIIRGVNGEFYPCKPDIFAKTYEAV